MDAGVEEQLRELTLSPENMRSIPELEKIVKEYRTFRVINLRMFRNLTDRLDALKREKRS